MVEGFTQQTKDNCIPKGQVCQSFDPILSTDAYREKMKTIIDENAHPNTHCTAPAYYYVFGINGEKFLCDMHFHLELRCMLGTPSWPRRDEYFSHVFSNAEAIKDTFGDPPEGDVPDENCWCGNRALVFFDGGIPTCNFHYRKIFYRFANNGKELHAPGSIVRDYRKLFIESVEEDLSLENLTIC